ncbi:MAG: trypsin-like peptidase domain-containing protein [Clostridium sp.]
MTNNERYEQDDNLASWESGIRYVEQKQRNKLPKVTRLVVISIVTAIIGGIIGASFMFIKYSNKLNGIEQKILEENSGDRNNRSIMKTAQKIGPSVVGISQTHTTWIDEASDGSLGSGIIFDNRGYIVTNQHIIDGIKNITVTLAGGKRVPGIIVGQDYKSDIAVVKINVENLKAVGFGDSNNLKAGATVIGMGNPLGEEFSGCLTVGVISATNKVIKVDDRTLSLLQTDMTLTKGNSGGAVVSENGDVVGIINGVDRFDLVRSKG